MLRFPALVLLALAALLVPAAGAHTRTRSSTSARTLHRETALGLSAPHRAAVPGRRGSPRTLASQSSSRRHLKQISRSTRPTARQQRRETRSTQLRQQDRRRVPTSRRELAHLPREHQPVPQPPATGRSATPDDFLDAARSHPDRASRNGRQSTTTQSQPRPAAAPVGVVSVIRRTTDHPQLQPVADAATAPLVLPTLPTGRVHNGVYAPLYGSHEILVHQNLMADRDGLDRILNDDDLMDKRRSGQLVPIPESVALRVDERLPQNRRYCRPWVAQFLAEMAQAHYARFHTPLQVNSAVRTVEFQQKLIHHNGNAAPADGDTASPHLTGQAVDLAKRWMPVAEISWIRGYLLPLMESGRIDVEEEFQQACFHISAYRGATPLPNPGSAGRYVAEAPGVPSAGAWSATTR